MKNFIENAPKISINNKKSVKKSKKCGCYFCCSIFSAKDVTLFVDSERSASCPLCGVDAVIPDSVVPELNSKMLDEMNKRWFGGVKRKIEMDEKLLELARECLGGIRTIMKKHELNGKVRTALALCAMKFLVSIPNNPYIHIENCKSFKEKKPLIQLLPDYFDEETWQEITSYVVGGINSRYKGYDVQDVLDYAAFMVDRPKSKEKQEKLDSIYDAMSTNCE